MQCNCCVPHEVVLKAIAEDKKAKSSKGTAGGMAGPVSEGDKKLRDDLARVLAENAKLKAQAGKEQGERKDDTEVAAQEEADEVGLFEAEVEFFKKAPASVHPSLLQVA